MLERQLSLATAPERHSRSDLPAHGVWSPALVPVDGAFDIDVDRFLTHASWLLEQGCHGVALFGTTSEATSFSVAERQRLLDAVLEAGLPPDRLMVGTGCCALTDSVELTRHAATSGCKKVLMLPPFYYKGLSDDALYRSFASVIERVGDPALRVFLYHFPHLTGVAITNGLVSLARRGYGDTVAGVKDSSGDWDNTRAMIDAFPDLAIFPGSETFLLRGLQAGGAGCITASANVNAAPTRQVFDAWERDSDEQGSLNERVVAVRRTIEAHPMVPALKYITAHYRGDPAWREVRPPLLSLSEPTGEALVKELFDMGFSPTKTDSTLV